jgi:hypothetical protein
MSGGTEIPFPTRRGKPAGLTPAGFYFMNKKISLCMIVGNVEEYIVRCLESFLPIADEVVLVRAIGNQPPDKTIPLATELLEKRCTVFKIGEYSNKAGHEDWPHIDDFAAARQMSFDLASNELCFWADTDDILLKGAEQIRNHAERQEFACYIFPYDIFGKGAVVPRERMMLRSAGKWKYPVHECFKFHVEPVHAAMDDNVVIRHMPKVTKTGSNERNLRILENIPQEEMTPGLKYHLFGELTGQSRKDDAIKVACQLLESNELGKSEHYDLLLSLVLQNEDLESRTRLLHEAHRIDPCRREALGTLATTMMDMGKPAEALAYARQMLCLPVPEDESWNSRKAFYGYVGDDICQQALRVNGKFAEAEKLRVHVLEKQTRPIISLLHATRGRPQQAARCRKAWHDMAEHPERVEHIFAFDSDDKDSKVLKRFHFMEVPAGGGCVSAWNHAALSCRGDILIQLSDDWIPPQRWDQLIIERLGDLTKPNVLAVSDGTRNDKLLCMAICTRAYFGHDWFLFHPFFTGVYSDNWFTDQAYKRGQVIEAKDLVFHHKHPAFGTAEVDQTYMSQNHPDRYAIGNAVYRYLQTGKDWSSVPGYFNYWRFYESVADEIPDGCKVVEVGSWFGRSIIFLAQVLKLRGKKNVQLYAVDTFKGEQTQPEHTDVVAAHGGSIRHDFEANIKRCEVDDMITIIEGDSAESAKYFDDGSLQFCYIDAAHDYESVKRDIAAWKSKVTPGALLAGHDAQWHEVQRAVKEAFTNPLLTGCVWMTVPTPASP